MEIIIAIGPIGLIILILVLCQTEEQKAETRKAIGETVMLTLVAVPFSLLFVFLLPALVGLFPEDFDFLFGTLAFGGVLIIGCLLWALVDFAKKRNANDRIGKTQKTKPRGPYTLLVTACSERERCEALRILKQRNPTGNITFDHNITRDYSNRFLWDAKSKSGLCIASNYLAISGIKFKIFDDKRFQHERIKSIRFRFVVDSFGEKHDLTIRLLKSKVSVINLIRFRDGSFQFDGQGTAFRDAAIDCLEKQGICFSVSEIVAT